MFRKCDVIIISFVVMCVCYLMRVHSVFESVSQIANEKLIAKWCSELFLGCYRRSYICIYDVMVRQSY